MKALRIALFATAALAVAGAAQAQDFQPKQKGTIMLNVRLTDVSSKCPPSAPMRQIEGSV